MPYMLHYRGQMGRADGAALEEENEYQGYDSVKGSAEVHGFSFRSAIARTRCDPDEASGPDSSHQTSFAGVATYHESRHRGNH